jgi:hypothetical protein
MAVSEESEMDRVIRRAGADSEQAILSEGIEAQLVFQQARIQYCAARMLVERYVLERQTM